MFQSEKLQRKQAKREKLERQAAECRRLKELLQLQNLLDSLGSETARSDFMSGNNGAVVSIKFVNVTTRSSCDPSVQNLPLLFETHYYRLQSCKAVTPYINQSNLFRNNKITFYISKQKEKYCYMVVTWHILCRLPVTPKHKL